MSVKGYVIRLYVGIDKADRNLETLQEVTGYAGAYFDGVTLFEGYGLWKGTPESSIVLEIVTSGQGKLDLARMLADDLRQRFRQESVLLTVQDLTQYELVE